MAETSSKEFHERVGSAFEVVDAILKGTLLPEPTEAEMARLGIADYDPELRYRVAKDVLEQWAGKPKQQIEQTGDKVPLVIMLPEHAAGISFQEVQGTPAPLRQLSPGQVTE